MLIRRTDLDRIARGEIDLAFRRWRRASVKAGGTLTTAIGVLAVEAVDRITPSQIDARDAERAGYASRAALLTALGPPDGGRDTASFKRDVRKLKALGLTESLEVGYRLAPRGRALLDRL